MHAAQKRSIRAPLRLREGAPVTADHLFDCPYPERPVALVVPETKPLLSFGQAGSQGIGCRQYAQTGWAATVAVAMSTGAPQSGQCVATCHRPPAAAMFSSTTLEWCAGLNLTRTLWPTSRWYPLS